MYNSFSTSDVNHEGLEKNLEKIPEKVPGMILGKSRQKSLLMNFEMNFEMSFETSLALISTTPHADFGVRGVFYLPLPYEEACQDHDL